MVKIGRVARSNSCIMMVVKWIGGQGGAITLSGHFCRCRCLKGEICYNGISLMGMTNFIEVQHCNHPQIAAVGKFSAS